MAEISSESQFFSGNIANMIPEGPLNKMLPLMEDHEGGGGGGGARGPPLAHGLSALCHMARYGNRHDHKNYLDSYYKWTTVRSHL